MDFIIFHYDDSKTIKGITHRECPILHPPYLTILHSSSWGGQPKDDGWVSSTQAGAGKEAYQEFLWDSTPKGPWPNSECKGQWVLCTVCIPAPSLGQATGCCTSSSIPSAFNGRRPFGKIEEDVRDEAVREVSCNPWNSRALEEGQPYRKVETSRWVGSCKLGKGLLDIYANNKHANTYYLIWHYMFCF